MLGLSQECILVIIVGTVIFYLGMAYARKRLRKEEWPKEAVSLSALAFLLLFAVIVWYVCGR